MKVAIFGSSGIIGQHMRLMIPYGVEAVWVRQKSDILHVGVDLTDQKEVDRFLNSTKPDVVVNLAGESRPDVVEKNPKLYEEVNVGGAARLACWCKNNGKRFIQVSTQAVFKGDEAPYSSMSPKQPINAYGKQKKSAEHLVSEIGGNYTIFRPTFVLGIRPMPAVGRNNPAELMLRPEMQKQVNDRWFSVSFAWEVAQILWEVAFDDSYPKVMNFGTERVTRFDLAKALNPDFTTPATSDEFTGIAPRPVDTTYAREVPIPSTSLGGGLTICKLEYEHRNNLSLHQRARELSIFFGMPMLKTLEKLSRGFFQLHAEVAEDFRKDNPDTHSELLRWYQNTYAYIWELSSYHLDPGFNYMGLCQGVADTLQTYRMKRVLCLGDGIGDLALYLQKRGFEPTYHDLSDSRTALFARMRFDMYSEKAIPCILTTSFDPKAFGKGQFDAVVSCDFLEHVPNVEDWVGTIHECLVDGGMFFAQNAFACGSGKDGSIPMHLKENDRFVTDWDPLLDATGFERNGNNWCVKKPCCIPSVSSQGDLVHEVGCRNA